MLTYHGDPALKADVLAQLAEHRRLDEIIQGTYWSDGKGCAVGCATHHPSGGHDQFPELWGIPEALAWLEDRVFEGVPPEDAKAWPERLMSAIPVGVEITDAFFDRLAIDRLTDVLTLAPTWPDSSRDEVVAVIEGVITVLRDGGHWLSAAESAAWSAESAALSAESAAWSAAGSAESAASAASAAESAASAAESAAWQREADRIIAALGELG